MQRAIQISAAIESANESSHLKTSHAIPRASFYNHLERLLHLPFVTLFKLSCLSYRSFYWMFRQLSPGMLEQVSKCLAKTAYYRALHRVPAYRAHHSRHGVIGGSIPETDKDTYIRNHSVEARCLEGVIPMHGTMIDESSGSTGIPYDWVRSQRERQESHRSISFFATYCYGNQPWITINAFSMGAWATGLNMGVALQHNSIVKNTGPDIGKMLHTLQFFGPNYTYLIAGYPPFLKRFVDEATRDGFPLERYRLNGLVGGEGMSEGLRDYLQQHFNVVYSGYGATDLEIGIAGETPLSVAIRRLAAKQPDVRACIFGKDPRLPMVFQYNPLVHHIEVNDQGELLFTINRKSILSPRIRYNVHDQGGVMPYDQMCALLQKMGCDLDSLLGNSSNAPMKLPFLWVFGRRDYTVSVMGANIYPEDIEQCLYANAELAAMTRSFCLSLFEEADGSVHPQFVFEVDGPTDRAMTQHFKDVILLAMLNLNKDFHEAYREYPDALEPVIQLHGIGQGPFAGDAHTIKQKRMLSTAHGDAR